MSQQGSELGLRGQQQRRVDGVNALGPQPHLRGRLLPGDVEDRGVLGAGEGHVAQGEGGDLGGGVGVGVINEAKTRTQAGKKVWVVGCDVDQYAEGLMPNGASIILTSAMKYLSTAAFDMIKDEQNGQFVGGRSLLLGAQQDGVGIPENNPNLSGDVQKTVDAIAAKIKAGEIAVSAEQGMLFK